jgi:hypothetical protein
MCDTIENGNDHSNNKQDAVSIITLILEVNY